MVEPEKKDFPPNLEDTVRNLREENAKLIQLLRSQGLILDNPSPKPTESSNITFDNSDISLTTNSVNTTNQITHQHVHNHGPINQQNYSGQIVHGNQSNITPNFNTVIQTTTQPFVQNNSNTLVQNNTNLIQPINLVNFNNVSLDSLQSFFAAQNNLVYLSQTSSSTTTTTTTTTTASNMNPNNESEQQHQISIRPKPSTIPQHQDLIPVLPKVKTEHYENLSRQLSTSSNSETTNLLDNDLNHKQPRPIRPKPSSRANSLQVYSPVILNETKPPTTNVLTPSSLINNNPSSTVSLLSPPTSFEEQHHIDLSPQLIQSKSMDVSIPPTNNLLTSTKKSNKNPSRNRKKPANTTSSSVIVPPNNQTLIPIAPNSGRPLAPAPINVQRIVTTNKRSVTNKKRNSKTLMQYHSESILQQNSSPPNSFAESISGLMQNFDQELIASNFLSQSTTTTTNILSNDPTSNVNIIRTLDNIDVRQIVNTSIHRTDSSYHSMPTLDEFNDRLEHETNQTILDYNVDNEQINSFMNEEDMQQFAEMNFDENTFLKQFDLDDAGIKLNMNSEQNIFASLLTNNHHLNTSIEQSNPPPPLPPPPIYPGSSLINNNVFTTVVPLGLQHQSSQNNSFNNNNSSRCLPEEGVQLTARHIEPSQVATYESVKYQDILDDLVTVTDQDVLTHVQAAAATDPTDFSFALLQATNDIIKSSEIPGAEESASAFVDLQYFYPIEQEQELLQKQLEQCEHKDEQPTTPIIQTETISSPKSVENSGITDLASIIQINQTTSSSPIKETPASIDYDLPPPPPPPPPTEYPPVFDNNPRKACIIFEPILSPVKSSEDELILDSGCLTNSSIEKSNPLNNDQIEELLNETPINQYEMMENQEQTSPINQFEIIENQGQTSPTTDVTLNNLDNLIEQIEPPTEKILEKNFHHYQQIYQENLKKKPKEQYSPIPSVKLKLNSIYPKHKTKQKSSPSPILICENVRPPLKIKIRTKLPTPPLPKIKIGKLIKKSKHKKPSLDEQIEHEAKLSLKTEYAGLTRFEQPLAELYQQKSSSSPDTQIPPSPGENENLTILPNKQDTPPTNEMKFNSTSPKNLTHLSNYNDEPLNNNTFITPPPDVDLSIQQQKKSDQNSKKRKKSQQQNSFINKDYYSSSTRKSQVLPTPQPPPIHMDPYTQSYHHFDSRTAPFFNFPFTNPFMNPHPTSTHYHHNSMKYHYPTHQPQFAYHPHLQRQQQYNNSNYMPSRDHHPFDR